METANRTETLLSPTRRSRLLTREFRCFSNAFVALAALGAATGCGDKVVNATEGSGSGAGAETGAAGAGDLSGSGGTSGSGTATSGRSGNGGSTAGGTPSTGVPDAPLSGSCDLTEPSFCETFDTRMPGGRGGDLDESIWSVARVSQKVNPSQGELVSWPATTLSACGNEIEGVFSDAAVTFCKQPETGRTILTSTFDDAEGPVFQSFRVIQPFDFTDRVGHITVDVDAKTQTPEGHGWWWEIVIADEPVPVPYQEFISHALMARRAIVIEFEGVSSFDGTTNEVSHVFVEDGYKYAREFTRDQANFVPFKTEEEVLNHLEILISKDFLEVYATDLDDASTFRRVARVDGLGLTFERGYVNFQHSSYNSVKGGLDPSTTYHFGSFGFDGPLLARPRSYQVLDALATGRTDNVKNLGYLLGSEAADTSLSFTIEGVDLSDAEEARMTFNAWYFTAERSIQFRFNEGEWRTFEHPYPESMEQTRAVLIPVDIADLQDGENVMELRAGGTSSEQPLVVSNIDLEVVPK